MTDSSDDTYVQTYQNYLRKEGSTEDQSKFPSSSFTASTKLIKATPKSVDCKICRVLVKPEDLNRILNQGLYYKYTSSQDYFYSRDINALLSKKKKPFCIKYQDDLIFDECVERLKGFFLKKEAVSMLSEARAFYTQFYNYPRNFHPHYTNIMSSNIRKHRRMEYIRVFKGVSSSERNGGEEEKEKRKKTGTGEDEKKENANFQFMEMLGDSFLKDNYRDVSNIVVGAFKLDKRRDAEFLTKEIEMNFKALQRVPQNAVNDVNTVNFSNALYNKNYMLYSRRDSETAEDMLKEIVNGFKSPGMSRKPSATLAEQVMNQPIKVENNNGPNIKPRMNPLIENNSIIASRKSLIPSTQKVQPMSTTNRGGNSNLRNSSDYELKSPEMISPSRLLEDRKSKTKFGAENLGMDRTKVLGNAYQFRSTRSKSGALKTVSSNFRSPNARSPQEMYNDTPVLDSIDESKNRVSFHMENSIQPFTVKAGVVRDENYMKPSSIVEVSSAQYKNSIETSPYLNKIKRSTSGDYNEYLASQKSPSQKSSSVLKRTVRAPKKHNLSSGVYLYTASNTSQSNATIVPPTIQESFAGSPNSKPVQLSSAGFNFRHQSPTAEDKGHGPEGYYFVPRSKIKNINIRPMKDVSPSRENDYRIATMSLSGRNHKLLESSQTINSFMHSQSTLHSSGKQQQGTQKRKKIPKFEISSSYPSKMKRGNETLKTVYNPMIVEEIKSAEKKRPQNLELNEESLNMKESKLHIKDFLGSQLMHTAPSTTTSKLKGEIRKTLMNGFSVKSQSKDFKVTLKK